MPDRTLHQQEVQSFLRQHIGGANWEFSLPHGWGSETYFARSSGLACFVKLRAQIPRCRAMAALGLTPEVLAAGCLADGTSILVQPLIAGRAPDRRDYRLHLEQFAAAIRIIHQNPEVRHSLPHPGCELYSQIGLETLAGIRQRWLRCRPWVPQVAAFVDHALKQLTDEVCGLPGAGLVASHNDICNANWLITPDNQLYLIDLDSMSMEDPAVDIGATLWWYYPPRLWHRFLESSGYPDDDAFRLRMRVRLAMQCLHIILPLQQSFDSFDPAAFPDALTDFRAALAGEANPQGFEN